MGQFPIIGVVLVSDSLEGAAVRLFQGIFPFRETLKGIENFLPGSFPF